MIDIEKRVLCMHINSKYIYTSETKNSFTFNIILFNARIYIYIL